MATWHAKNRLGYSKTSSEGWDNIQLIFSNLVRNGFTDEAACGVLANIEQETGFNPWRWENDNPMTYNQSITEYIPSGMSYPPGYGLCGWTPSAKYTKDDWHNLGVYPSTYRGYAPNFADQQGNASDGHAQCQFIIEGQQYNWVTSGSGRVNVSVSQFRSLTDAAYAAEVWCRNYEYPRDLEREVAERRQAVTWYANRLVGSTPVPDPLDALLTPIVLLMKKAIDNSMGRI